MMAAQLQQFFKACDPEGTRSVDIEAFRDLCSRLNIAKEDADVIFEDLDLDRDGRISFTDFSRGFSNFISTTEACDASSIQDQESEIDIGNSDEATKQHVWTTLTNEAERVGKKSSDEGKLKWLLNELQMSEQRHLVPYLESAVEELITNLHQLQEEKSRLEDTWRREKIEHEKHLKRMEEELDNQVKEAELKMRLKAQEEVEEERKTLQSRMDSEFDKLQSHLQLMEKVYSWLRTQPTEQRDVRLDEVRTKLDEAVHDNRQLRMSLLDTQTSIALMRSELLQLRTMYEEKCRELSSERERILEVLQEQDHLSRQLNLLHDANKRLLDSHDVLRNNVENPGKQGHTNIYRCKSGSIIGDYLEPAHAYDITGRFQEDENDEDSESGAYRRPKSMDSTYTCQIRRRPKPKDRQLAQQSLNQSDSGVSTVRDSGEVDENWDISPPCAVDSEDEYTEIDHAAISRRERLRRDSGQSRASRPASMPPPASEKILKIECYPRGVDSYELQPSNSQDSLLPTDTLPRRKISDIKKQLGIEDKPVSWNRSWSPNPAQCSTPKEQSNGYVPTPMPRASKINCIYESIDNDDSLPITSQSIDNSVEVEQLYEPTGPPEQTFKVIFVGDAGVGKSSFALRISKGVFVRHMSSTLGLDFLMRTLRVDGKNVAVQLWDTAGQERFRSITKTYFRKADGVMLLYDCTCEQSFLNVRQWVEDIDKSSNQRIPLMIVANKIDLREMAIKTGTICVTTEQGEKLAKDCDTTFMEGSAKDGSNVLHALANLVRSMIARKDLQLSASTMQLCEAKPKKSCCGK
ncbi:ras and EF-hand domain-containing protein-like isoform X2 [Argiope bruennichi]|uniref:ras and EF-hand domain-containing protein-like isoform X2 n=1 Tax=Argiope bruennichi TaxID=94029 RepID=UPI0024950C64|nr:ras and EF-hand domain-containing protein-like isoform X2 [Argiope bruennichi]